jgi:hypothetical protein
MRFVWLGLALALVGAVLGFFPVSKSGVGCGSAFGGGGEAMAKDFASTLTGSAGLTHYVEACADNLQIFRVLAIVLIIIGLAVAAVMNPPRKEPAEDDAPAERPMV